MSNADFVQKVYDAAIALGIPDVQARVAATQAALETDYGRSAPGNNYFGIKGSGQTLSTKEASNGALKAIDQNFKVYGDLSSSISDWYRQMQRNWPGVLTATTYADAIDALNHGRLGSYATDKVESNDPLTYQDKLAKINTQYLGGTPIPPNGISGLPVGAGNVGRSIVPVPLPRPRPDPNALQSLPPPPLDNRPIPQGPNGWWDSINTDQPGMLGRGLPATGPTPISGQLDMSGMLGRRLPVIPGPLSGMPSVGTAAGPNMPQAPIPTPRPASLTTIPLPIPRPSAPAPSNETPKAGVEYARLPSGQMIAVGSYPSSNLGSSVTITRGSDGNAIITRNDPGFMNIAKMGSGTVAGGYIGNAVKDAAPKVTQAVTNTATAAATNLGNTANTLKDNLTSTAGNAFNGIMGLFGGGSSPPAVPAPPVIPSQAQMQAIRSVPSIIPPTSVGSAFTPGGWGSAGLAAANLSASQAPAIANKLPAIASSAAQGASAYIPPAPVPFPRPANLSVPPQNIVQQILANTTAGKIYQYLDNNLPGGIASGIHHNGSSSMYPSPSPSYSFAPQTNQPVHLASGSNSTVGAVGTSQGGRYVYQVQPDGSVRELTTGRTTAGPNGPIGMAAYANGY